MRFPLFAAAALVLSAASLSAQASSLTYTLTGTANGQPVTLDFGTSSAGPYTPTTTSTGVSFSSEAENMTLDGSSDGSGSDEFFTLTSAPGVSWLEISGVNLAFDGDLFSCTTTCSLNTGTFALNLADTNAGLSGSGITFESGSLAVSSTPEPCSIALFATGLLACAGFIRRRVIV